MILVGQYDSPYVRRVAVSMRQTNPLARIPSLVFDDGEVLIDSAAILDWLDETVGPARALLPRAGPERRRALGLIALGTGVMDKAVSSIYERAIRPAPRRWPEWVARCRTQAAGALAALAREPWLADARLSQPEITTACMLRYVQMVDPELLPQGRYPTLEALSARCEARPE